MNRKPIATAAALLLSLAVGSAGRAADVVGFNKVVVPPSSEVVVTVPFVRASLAQMTASGHSGTGITVSAALPVNAYQGNNDGTGTYQGAHYVRVTSGTAAGRWSTISGNTASEITLADTSFLGSVDGCTFDIVPHQTLDSVFPAEMKGVSFFESTDTAGTGVSTMVYLPNETGVSINKAADRSYLFHGGNWKRTVSPFGVCNNVVLSPDCHFKLRNRDGVKSLTYVVSGKATSNFEQARNMRTETLKWDVPAVTGFSMPVSLRELKLGGTDAFTTSLGTSGTDVKDLLLVYINVNPATGDTYPGFNQAARSTYFYFNDAWRKTGESASGYPSHDADLLPAGAAVIARKAAVTTPTNYIWSKPKSE